MLPALRLLICDGIDGSEGTDLRRLLGDCPLLSEIEPQAHEHELSPHCVLSEIGKKGILVDGLLGGGKQRCFAIRQRRFIVASVPKNAMRMCNLAPVAACAELAILVTDAREGISHRIVRQGRLVSMLGIRNAVLLIDKMETMGWDRGKFEMMAARYRSLAEPPVDSDLQVIPLVTPGNGGLSGQSAAAPWYRGPSLLEHLETVEVASSGRLASFHMTVDGVDRPGRDPPCYRGRVLAGSISVGDRVKIAPPGNEAQITSIVDRHGARETAVFGDAVAMKLSPEIGAARGDVIVATSETVEVVNQFQAHLLWMGDEDLIVGRNYLMKLHTCQVKAKVTRIKHRLDVDNGNRLATLTLALDDFGTVNIATERAVPFTPYDDCQALGGFALVDPTSNDAVAFGMINFALRRAANIRWQRQEVGRAARAALKLQSPSCLWLTGLSGAGKSTIANLLEERLFAEGRHTYLLDGDNVRHGLSQDLGFSEADRVENIRRVAEVARLMVDAGLIVIVAFISPFRADREFARGLFAPGEFKEIFIDASLAACETRDRKGLYAKARSGTLKNFTGIDSPYEPPTSPELRLDTESMSPEECVKLTLDMLLTQPSSF